jgi:hypothetical protein
MSKLLFSTFSGGRASFDLDLCLQCASKACVAACTQPNLGCVLKLEDGLPALAVSAQAAARGACTECLACDLACQSDGIGGLDFALPMPEWDEHIAELRSRGVKPGFED